MNSTILQRRTYIKVLKKLYQDKEISHQLYIEILKGELENIANSKVISVLTVLLLESF
jgi:hypothetical protein